MGCAQSGPAATATKDPASAMASQPESAPESVIVEVALKKHRPGCTGMFWRSDPTGATQLESNNNWPRDDAKLRGRVVTTSEGEKWLLCSHVQQKGGTEWIQAPKGAAMPFEYNDHYYLE